MFFFVFFLGSFCNSCVYMPDINSQVHNKKKQMTGSRPTELPLHHRYFGQIPVNNISTESIELFNVHTI